MNIFEAERATRFCWRCQGRNVVVNIKTGAVAHCYDCEPDDPDDIMDRCGYDLTDTERREWARLCEQRRAVHG